MLLALVPLYLTEVAPPHRRGVLTGLTTMSFGLGYTSYVCGDVIAEWRLMGTVARGYRLELTMPPTSRWVGDFRWHLHALDHWRFLLDSSSFQVGLSSNLSENI